MMLMYWVVVLYPSSKYLFFFYQHIITFLCPEFILFYVGRIVASASMPTCCCFSPIKTTLVFGGMQDGSLVAWDLREPPTMHHSYICGGQDWLLRFPTYNTAGVLQYDNHNSPITALVPVLTDSGKAASQGACFLHNTYLSMLILHKVV